MFTLLVQDEFAYILLPSVLSGLNGGLIGTALPLIKCVRILLLVAFDIVVCQSPCLLAPECGSVLGREGFDHRSEGSVVQACHEATFIGLDEHGNGYEPFAR